MDRIWNKMTTHNLCSGSNWSDCESTICSTVFGRMLDIAQDTLKAYRSDLFHDAIWLQANLTGPMSFDWIVRDSGTHIGEVVQHINQDEWFNSAKYRFDIREEGSYGRWMLDIYEAVPMNNEPGIEDKDLKLIEDVLDVSCIGYFDNGSLQHNGNNCPVHEEGGGLRKYALEPPMLYCNHDHVAVVDGVCECGTIVVPSVTTWEPMEANVTIDKGFENNFPPLRNETIKNIREENKMESIVQELREKMNEADMARDEAKERKYELGEVIQELTDYIDDMANLIDSLSELPSASVSINFDIEFES